MPATLSAPDLRRQKADRMAEWLRLCDEYSKDGARPTAEQSKQTDDMYKEIENGGTFDELIKQAERYAVISAAQAKDREGNGRLTNPLPSEDPANTRKGRHAYSL